MTLNLLVVTLLAMIPTVLLWTWLHAPMPSMSESIRTALSDPDARIRP